MGQEVFTNRSSFLAALLEQFLEQSVRILALPNTCQRLNRIAQFVIEPVLGINEDQAITIDPPQEHLGIQVVARIGKMGRSKGIGKNHRSHHHERTSSQFTEPFGKETTGKLVHEVSLFIQA